MTPDAVYVSLNFNNPELKKIEPWAGTHNGPEALPKVFAGIQSFWKGMVDQHTGKVTLTRVGGWQGSDTGYEAGTYTAMMGTGNDTGKYMLTLKKGADGKWLINNDIFNSDLPCPPRAPAK